MLDLLGSGHGGLNADAGDECAVVSRPRGGDGLIGAFAVGGGKEFATEDWFTGQRDSVHPDNHVGIGF